MKLYANEFQSEVDGTGSIVAYSTFYDSAGDIVKTKVALRSSFSCLRIHAFIKGEL